MLSTEHARSPKNSFRHEWCLQLFKIGCKKDVKHAKSTRFFKLPTSLLVILLMCFWIWKMFFILEICHGSRQREERWRSMGWSMISRFTNPSILPLQACTAGKMCPTSRDVPLNSKACIHDLYRLCFAMDQLLTCLRNRCSHHHFCRMQHFQFPMKTILKCSCRSTLVYVIFGTPKQLRTGRTTQLIRGGEVHDTCLLKSCSCFIPVNWCFGFGFQKRAILAV